MFIIRIKYLEVVHLDNCMKVRHLRLRESFPYDLIHKEDLCLRVVHKVMDICRLEFMKKRNGNRSVCHYRKKGYSPVRLISGTDCDLVTFLKTALLKHDMQFLHSSCHILVVECFSTIIGNRRTIPVLLKGVLEDFVY